MATIRLGWDHGEDPCEDPREIVDRGPNRQARLDHERHDRAIKRHAALKAARSKAHRQGAKARRQRKIVMP